MKTKLSVCTLLFTCLLLTGLSAQAQETPPSELYLIHEDVVYPAMVVQYEKAANNLKAMFKKHQIASMNYSAATTMDYTYMYITPVNKISDIEKMNTAFGELQQKMGEDAFEKSMGMFNDCYDSHRDYIVRYHKDFSYKPDYGYDLAGEMNFRVWDTYHIYPGKEAELQNVLKKWKELFTKHSIETGYRIYTGDLGTDMPVMTIVQSAKGPIEYYTAADRMMKSLGEEGEALWGETIKLVRKIEIKTGMMRPDLSYLNTEMASADE